MGTTPLPTAPNSVSRPTTFNADADAFLAALVVYQAELDALYASMSPIGRNMLINGGFDVNQRAAATNADDTYAFDRWNILTQTGTIAASQIGPGIESGYNNAMRLTQSQASAQRFGFSQIIEGVNCKQARGGSGTLSGRVRCSAATTIRYAILGWTSTEDAVTSDVVLSWTSGVFTAGNFFLAANLSVLGAGSLALSANIWTSLTALTAALGTSFNNIVILVWTDSAQAQNVTLDCDYMQFEYGANSTPFEKRSYSRELVDCSRYFQSRSWGISEQVAVSQATAAGAMTGKIWDLAVQMRASPTISYVGGFVAYNASTGATGAITIGSTAANKYGQVAISGTVAGSPLVAGNASLIGGGAAGATATADAEL